MFYWVLTEMCKVLARTTVQHVMQDDLQLPHVAQKMNQFDIKVKEGLNNCDHKIKPPPDGLILEDETLDNDEPEEPAQVDRDDFTNEAYDAYLAVELLVPHGDTYIQGCVIKRARDDDNITFNHRRPAFNNELKKCTITKLKT